MQYRLMCCSDTHGKAPPVPQGAPVHAWLHAGDAYEGPTIAHDDEEPLPGDPIAEPMRAWLRTCGAPIYGVHGNHDVADPYGWFGSIEAVDRRVARLAPRLVIVGIGWNGEKYYELPGESDLQRVCNSARRQVLRLTLPSDRIVLLTHYPPRMPGLFPMKHSTATEPGSEAVANFLREVRPVLVVQGHEHFWFGRTADVELEGGRRCLIVNPGASGMLVVVDLDAGRARVE
jgi:Icc-related predicted phosphoesterase